MKRFIAGAVCPECRALDRIVLELRDGGQEWQRCVTCGYESVRPDVNQGHIGVPRGKPERRSTNDQKIASQTVKIMDLQPKLNTQDESK